VRLDDRVSRHFLQREERTKKVKKRNAMSEAQLIAYLETVAASFEAETGVPDPEIRAKIAELQRVLAQRQTIVRPGAGATGAQEPAAAGEEDVAEGAEAAIRKTAAQMVTVESALAQVESELAADDDAKHFLAQTAELWLPVIHGHVAEGEALDEEAEEDEE
jgi:hypothetical protein